MADISGEFGLSSYLWYNRRIIKSRISGHRVTTTNQKS
jgi:hypothetical protein